MWAIKLQSHTVGFSSTGIFQPPARSQRRQDQRRRGVHHQPDGRQRRNDQEAVDPHGGLHDGGGRGLEAEDRVGREVDRGAQVLRDAFQRRKQRKRRLGVERDVVVRQQVVGRRQEEGVAETRGEEARADEGPDAEADDVVPESQPRLGSARRRFEVSRNVFEMRKVGSAAQS